MPAFRGLFMNLDRNQARLASMAQHLVDVGMAGRYQRFPAVDGRTLGPEYVTKLDRGNLGLWLSHERLLAANKSSDAHLHVLEDDALLPKDAEVCFAKLLAGVEKGFPDWDMIFTDVLVNLEFPLFQLIAKCKKSYLQMGQLTCFPLKDILFSCAASFFISRKSIDKYLRLIEGRWTEGMPVDIHLRNLINQGSLNAYVTLPFATSLSENADESDIRGGLDLSRKVLNLYRASLFKDADLDHLAKELRRLTASTKVSDLAECYLEAAKFALSDQWIHF
jgi:GR25 family glycosyltransferase involved in LPS biosynthesis